MQSKCKGSCQKLKKWLPFCACRDVTYTDFIIHACKCSERERSSMHGLHGPLHLSACALRTILLFAGQRRKDGKFSEEKMESKRFMVFLSSRVSFLITDRFWCCLGCSLTESLKLLGTDLWASCPVSVPVAIAVR